MIDLGQWNRIKAKTVGKILRTLFLLCFEKQTLFWALFSPCTPVSSANETDCHDIIEILLKVALSIISQPSLLCRYEMFSHESNRILFPNLEGSQILIN